MGSQYGVLKTEVGCMFVVKRGLIKNTVTGTCGFEESNWHMQVA